MSNHRDQLARSVLHRLEAEIRFLWWLRGWFRHYHRRNPTAIGSWRTDEDAHRATLRALLRVRREAKLALRAEQRALARGDFYAGMTA